MIKGDEGKPMSILEMISDEPRDARPYVDYLLDWQRGHRDHWATGEHPAHEFVVSQIDSAIDFLENLAQKMDREANEE